MKKLAIVVVLLYVHAVSFAQRSYKFYDVTLNAPQLLGNPKSSWFPAGANEERSAILNPPKPYESLYSCLGSIYDYNDKESMQDLLNSDFDEDSPILDTINIHFYLASIRKLDQMFDKDSTYLKFYDEFTKDKLSCHDRKRILDERKYKAYKTALLNSRFKTVDFKDLNITTEVASVVKLGVAAKIKLALDKYNLGANAKALIDREISRNVKASEVTYYSIRLDPQYILVVKRFIKPHYTKSKISDRLEALDDNFSSQLKSYLESQSQSIVSYATVIKSKFVVTDVRAVVATLGAGLKGELKPVSGQTVAEAGAELEAEISKSIKQTVDVSGGTTYYMICYARDNNLEIGNGEISTVSTVVLPRAH